MEGKFLVEKGSDGLKESLAWLEEFPVLVEEASVW